jgi:hypothetical protein
VSPVKYELGYYIPEHDILHSHRRDKLKSYMDCLGSEERQKWACVNTVMNLCVP